MTRFECIFPGRSGRCRVYSGTGILGKVISSALTGRYSSVLAVVDRKVAQLYNGTVLRDVLRGMPVYRQTAGERAKSLRGLGKLLRWLHDQEADRRSLLLAVGGGVVTDLAGFAASCYMRGLDFVAAPTTLVGQVDASLGGKSAINLDRTKNVVGAFHLPKMVVCDQAFLGTLKPAALKDGLVEILKLFLALDTPAFNRFAGGLEPITGRQDYTALIDTAIGLKLKVVARDPYERGLRRVLNLGHTAGHAYEALTGFSHGKSVALGLLVAIELSHRDFGLAAAERDRAVREVLAIHARLASGKADERQLWDKIKHDKKRVGGQVSFVVLPRIGKHLVAPITYRQFANAWRRTMERIAR